MQFCERKESIKRVCIPVQEWMLSKSQDLLLSAQSTGACVDNAFQYFRTRITCASLNLALHQNQRAVQANLQDAFCVQLNSAQLSHEQKLAVTIRCAKNYVTYFEQQSEQQDATGFAAFVLHRVDDMLKTVVESRYGLETLDEAAGHVADARQVQEKAS